MSAHCRHLTQADEAWSIDAATGKETPIVVFLCGWADDNPDRMLNVPRWLSVYALSGGPSFEPERHCPGCPCFAAGE